LVNMSGEVVSFTNHIHENRTGRFYLAQLDPRMNPSGRYKSIPDPKHWTKIRFDDPEVQNGIESLHRQSVEGVLSRA